MRWSEISGYRDYYGAPSHSYIGGATTPPDKKNGSFGSISGIIFWIQCKVKVLRLVDYYIKIATN